jgi:hypothetical protein
VLELALLHEVHEPLEGDDAEDKGDGHAHQEFRCEAARIGALGGLFGVFQGHLEISAKALHVASRKSQFKQKMAKMANKGNLSRFFIKEVKIYIDFCQNILYIMGICQRR